MEEVLAEVDRLCDLGVRRSAAVGIVAEREDLDEEWLCAEHFAHLLNRFGLGFDSELDNAA